ncbi:MAG: alpha/beta hydrolase [Chloroflexi bacterium]|nr:alpha/beta hydrolase [Chloroflexota bacterium]
MAEPSARVQIEEGVAFASAGGRELRCDAFRPAGQSGPQPGILLVHGGGWHMGAPAMMRGYGILMARHGYPCVASEYRLSGEAKWPAQFDDVLAAIRWMQDEAGELGIDPARLVLWGLSAGSHMSLLAAARLSGEASPIAATVNHYPITSLEPALGTAWEHAQRLPEDPATADWAAMSPLSHVGAGFPPTLLLHGSADAMVVLDQSLRLYEALTGAGVPTDLAVFADQPHGFDLQRAFALQSIEVVRFFLSRYAPLTAEGDAA